MRQMRRILAALLIALTCTIGLGATQGAGAADPGAENDFAARINALRASVGAPGLTQHPVLTAKAEAWAQHMADSGCLCHSNLPDGVTVGWRKLGENIGRGPSVASIHDALVHSSLHYANMVDGAFHWVGVGVAYGNGQMYVAEVFMDGDAPAGPSPLLALDSRGRSIAARAQGGFWIMEGNGTVHGYEGAPAYGSPHFPGDYARSIAVTPDGKGFAVLDGYGGYHPFGNAPAVSGLPYWPGWDIARSIAFRPGGGLYMLDGFGTVWNRGGAPQYCSPYFGWDIARDITAWPDEIG